jgi:hypothetical protein
MTSTVLKTPIAELGVTSAFAERCEKMGYETLEGLLREDPETMRSKKEFDYLWLCELIDLLKKNNLLYLLQSKQGNSKV